MWSTLVPIWSTDKYPSMYQGGRVVLLGRVRGLLYWSNGMVMATNKRQASPWSDAVAATVRAERARRGLIQRDVIERSGIPRSTYVKIESGVHVADTTEIAHICGAFGLGLGEFFHLVEDEVMRQSRGES